MSFIEQYLLQLKTEKRRWRRAVAILTALSLVVALVTVWNLRMTGVTIANSASCGYEEHQHTQECVAEAVLICGLETAAEETAEPTEEATEATEEITEPTEEITEATEETTEPTEETEPQPTHIHTDACYTLTYSCGLEEHIHKISCYSDPSADLETANIWEQSLPHGLGDDWAENMVRIALSQIGVAESERNFILAGDGVTKQGITRYGQWYGNPYGDWSSMFALFCLHYAEIPREAVPWSPGVYNMMRLAQDAQIITQPDDDSGSMGNLLFLDTDANGKADRLMVVAACANGSITAIGGDWENTVAEITLSDRDPSIVGYINIGQLQASRQAQEESAPTDDAQETIPEETLQGSDEMSEEPAISLDVEFPEEGILRIVARISNIEEAMYTWQWQVSEDGNEPWVDIDGATGLVCDLEDTEENFNRFYRLQGRKVAMMFKARAAETGTDGQEDGNTIISAPIAPFSIEKNNRTYTIDVYAIPVDADGNRITELALTELDSFSVTYNSGRVTVQDRFDTDLGHYQSAYFGTAATVSVDNIDSVWCGRYYNWGYQYTLAYRQTNGTENDRWLTGANTNVSLYMRYIPEFTVTFESEGFTPLTETVQYGGFPTQTAPGAWLRDGYTLLGWTANGSEQNVYTFEELLKLPVTGDVTYTAKWVQEVAVSFNLGAYVQDLYPIEQIAVPYGSTISPLPTPIWKNNAVAMSFDGWYLDEELSRQVTADQDRKSVV